MFDSAIRPARWSSFATNHSDIPTVIQVVPANRVLSFNKPTGEGMFPPDEQQDLSSIVLAALVGLLVLLAAVVWIAFCLALHRTAKRISEIKRQRRRQVLIANAIHHALSENRFVGNRSAMPAYLASLSPTMAQQMVADLELRDLPSYEQAVQMGSSPVSPIPEPSSECKKKRPSVERVIRIAPSRRGSSSVPIHPPPYMETHPTSPIPSINGGRGPIPTVSASINEQQESHV